MLPRRRAGWDLGRPERPRHAETWWATAVAGVVLLGRRRLGAAATGWACRPGGGPRLAGLSSPCSPRGARSEGPRVVDPCPGLAGCSATPRSTCRRRRAGRRCGAAVAARSAARRARARLGVPAGPRVPVLVALPAAPRRDPSGVADRRPRSGLAGRLHRGRRARRRRRGRHLAATLPWRPTARSSGGPGRRPPTRRCGARPPASSSTTGGGVRRCGRGERPRGQPRRRPGGLGEPQATARDRHPVGPGLPDDRGRRGARPHGARCWSVVTRSRVCPRPGARCPRATKDGAPWVIVACSATSWPCRCCSVRVDDPPPARGCVCSRPRSTREGELTDAVSLSYRASSLAPLIGVRAWAPWRCSVSSGPRPRPRSRTPPASRS